MMAINNNAQEKSGDSPEQPSTSSDPLSIYSAPSAGCIISLSAKSYHT